MKVVDFFAASVPVCAFDYGGALPEQIRDRENGFVFRTAEQLAAILNDVARNPQQLDAMRRRVRESAGITWTEDWNRILLPLLR